ncbi:MAG: PepSY domain-containing protein [Variibacter sp.]
MRLILASAILAASTLASFAAAPEGQKLSEIIAKIEQNAEVQYVDEVDWKHRRGYYEIEYIRKDGAKVKLRIDPKTGQTVTGRR